MSECIEWHLSRSSNGCGQKKFQGKMRPAHRLAYVDHHGLELDDIRGKVVMHLCDNPPCVNVDHLRLGTQADNNADREAKGRGRRPLSSGEAHGNAKLTEYAVRWVRSYHATGDYTQQELADMYGIRRSTAGRIITRERWKHV